MSSGEPVLGQRRGKSDNEQDRLDFNFELNDGRTVGVPLAWFPRLLHAAPTEREQCRIGATGQGLHWETLNEDISVEGLLAGRGDMTVRHPVAA